MLAQPNSTKGSSFNTHEGDFAWCLYLYLSFISSFRFKASADNYKLNLQYPKRYVDNVIATVYCLQRDLDLINDTTCHGNWKLNSRKCVVMCFCLVNSD